MAKKVNVTQAAGRLADPFEHLAVGQVDDYSAYLVRIVGNYLFHQHPKDEMYLVLEGEMAIDYADGASVMLGPMDSLAVRAGEKHRSRSERGALVLMFKARDLFAE